jgi:hypothetical protein
MAASIRKTLDGTCVYTIVLIRPIRAAREVNGDLLTFLKA